MAEYGHDKPLGFDLLAKTDAITALSSINIMPTGAVLFSSKETPTSAVIHIEQP